MIQALDSSWRDWIVTNLRRDCTRESIVCAMVAKDFEPDFAAATVAALAAEIAGTATSGRATNAPMDAKQADRLLGPTATPNVGNRTVECRLPIANALSAGGRAVPVLARLSKPEVLVLGQVLSDDECEKLIQRSEAKLARSTTVDPKTGQEIVIERRSSFGTFFHLQEDDFIAGIDRRLAELLQWPVDRAEGLQILRYEVGGEYRPHFDYFPPDDPGSRPHMEQRGQRIGTLVLYLNDVADGGETIFPEIGLSVVPRRGHGVYFGYFNSKNEVDPMTLHGGAPVRAGVKWIATKWLRQRAQ